MAGPVEARGSAGFLAGTEIALTERMATHPNRFAAALGSLVMLGACGGAGGEARPAAPPTSPPDSRRVAKVKITPETALLTAAGETRALRAEAFDAEGVPVPA